MKSIFADFISAGVLLEPTQLTMTVGLVRFSASSRDKCLSIDTDWLLECNRRPDVREYEKKSKVEWKDSRSAEPIRPCAPNKISVISKMPVKC